MVAQAATNAAVAASGTPLAAQLAARLPTLMLATSHGLAIWLKFCDRGENRSDWVGARTDRE